MDYKSFTRPPLDFSEAHPAASQGLRIAHHGREPERLIQVRDLQLWQQHDLVLFQQRHVRVRDRAPARRDFSDRRLDDSNLTVG
ncbi:MAG: hypothetical protein JSR66_13050 [Proteobacteria bacterium]|nr:hypothetical protein [Pseudomonadota bacterium]